MTHQPQPHGSVLSCSKADAQAKVEAIQDQLDAVKAETEQLVKAKPARRAAPKPSKPPLNEPQS